METVSIWIQPAVLVTAFIFFWREAKGSRRDVRAEMLEVEKRILDRMDEKLEAKDERFDARSAAMSDRFDAQFAAMSDRFDAQFAAMND
ncbi:MAG: hypothetical protein F4X08_04240 [Gemmatimonadetes bacterium]|nr:hypothetical protein [Gemmatimonadota bacterium]